MVWSHVFPRKYWLGLVSLLAFAGCLLAGCQRQRSVAVDTTQETPRPESTESSVPQSETLISKVAFTADDESITNRPIQKPHDGYVSSSACLECHPNEHDSWSHSYHRTMTQVVCDESVAGGFEGKSQEIYGWQFKTEKRGDQHWATLESTTGDAAHEYQLVMSTGSHHMQKFWYHTGKSRKMGMLPMVYLIEADKWLPEKSAFLSPPQTELGMREGAWNTGCNQCHATGSHPRITSMDEMDTVVAEFGISCEACHGPGEKHVKEKTANSIVNPRGLSAIKSAQVCGQCHGAWLRTNKDTGTRWSQTGNVYRPGDDLFELRYYPHGKKDKPLHEKLRAIESFWPDGENRVAGRELNGLLASPCHNHELSDDSRMSCISCHDLHTSADDKKTWANDQMDEGMYGNEACLQCHETFREKLVEHTHHAANSAGSLCYNCHMPYTSYGLLKAVRTHTIGNPSAQASIDSGKINACNQCHLDETLEWTSKNLSSMYGHPDVDVYSDDKKVAASIMWSLKGDAAQRALMAWSMGWEDAQKASGTSWMILYLADLMFDDYDAIRYIAYRSLKSIPGYESIQYDHMRPQEERERVMKEVLSAWNRTTKERPTDAKLLYDSNGEIQNDTYQGLRQLRDTRLILVTE